MGAPYPIHETQAQVVTAALSNLPIVGNSGIAAATSNQCLVICVTIDGIAQTVTSITAVGSGLTFTRQAAINGTASRTEIWTSNITSIPRISINPVVNFSASCTSLCTGVLYDDVASIGSSITASGTATSASSGSIAGNGNNVPQAAVAALSWASAGGNALVPLAVSNSQPITRSWTFAGAVANPLTAGGTVGGMFTLNLRANETLGISSPVARTLTWRTIKSMRYQRGLAASVAYSGALLVLNGSAEIVTDLTWQFGTYGKLLNSSPTLPYVDVSSVAGMDLAEVDLQESDIDGASGSFVHATYTKRRLWVIAGTAYGDVANTPGGTGIDDYLESLKTNFQPSAVDQPFFYKQPNRKQGHSWAKSIQFNYDYDATRRIGSSALQAQLSAADPRLYDSTLWVTGVDNTGSFIVFNTGNTTFYPLTRFEIFATEGAPVVTLQIINNLAVQGPTLVFVGTTRQVVISNLNSFPAQQYTWDWGLQKLTGDDGLDYTGLAVITDTNGPSGGIDPQSVANNSVLLFNKTGSTLSPELSDWYVGNARI